MWCAKRTEENFDLVYSTIHEYPLQAKPCLFTIHDRAGVDYSLFMTDDPSLYSTSIHSIQAQPWNRYRPIFKIKPLS